MFLTHRFFYSLAFLIVLSVVGFYFPQCYYAARFGVLSLVLAVGLDALFLWLFVRVRGSRQCKPCFSLAGDNAVILRVENRCRQRLWLTVRDELPREFRFHDAVFNLSLERGQGKTVRYVLRPTSRGEYRFGHVLVFVRSAIGLLERKMKCGEGKAVKVYPAFEHLDRYEIAAASTDPLPPGQKRVRRPGNSTDFEQIKEYVTGDDFRSLNWKASARAGRWMVNTYRDEMSQPVWCLIDKGRVMQRTFRHTTLLDYAINASLVLSYVALRRYDMPGLITFDAKIDKIVAASRRPGQLSQLLEALYAQQVRYAEADYSALTVHLARHVRRRSLLVLFTDFTSRDALHRQLPYLRRLSKAHCLLVVFFDDEEVRALSEQSATSLHELRVSALAADFLLTKQSLVAELRQCGICTLLTCPSRLAVDIVNKYIELKRRQAV